MLLSGRGQPSSDWAEAFSSVGLALETVASAAVLDRLEPAPTLLLWDVREAAPAHWVAPRATRFAWDPAAERGPFVAAVAARMGAAPDATAVDPEGRALETGDFALASLPPEPAAGAPGALAASGAEAGGDGGVLTSLSDAPDFGPDDDDPFATAGLPLMVTMAPEVLDAGGQGDKPGLQAAPAHLLAGRYERLGELGEGGMGQVWSVRDHHLKSVMAMKVLRPALGQSPELLARFVAEAQATAQLQHPGIVPVHELGTLGDGRIFFTMELVQGRTLTELAEALHADTRAKGHWGAAGRFTLRRLLTALHQATQAVAYAHARGVLHRDLKPDNLMLGDFGEVRVLDWGLARVTGQVLAAVPGGDPAAAGQGADRSADLNPVAVAHSGQTRVGQISGTPAYMAPEQAWGRLDQIGPQTDVYALGGTLYHLLVGKTPHRGSVRDALESARSGAVPAAQPLAPVADELLELVAACLAPDPSDRPANAGVLDRLLGDFLDGAKRRDLALALVDAAGDEAERARRFSAQRAEAKAEAEGLRDEINAFYEEGTKRGDNSPAPVDLVRRAWAAEDRLAARDRDAQLAHLAEQQRLQAALHHVPTLPEAHAALAWFHRARHDAAAAAGDAGQAAQHEALVRQHDATGRHAAWLARTGTLCLAADAPGATVVLARCEDEERRRVPRPLSGALAGPQALPCALTVPAGSYVLTVAAPGRETVTVAAEVPREGTWDRTPPEGGPPRPLALPAAGTAPAGACLVPAGWAWIGGNDRRFRTTLHRQRVWVEGFWAERHPVTNRRYLAFLNALVDAGDPAAAAAHVPRYRGADEAPVYGRDAAGRYVLVPDSDGDLWHPDWPVVLVGWRDAVAFAAWQASTTGRPWRLPTEHEWRVACGGVDGRRFPWGTHPVDHYANSRNGSPGPSTPEPVGAFPTDASPYGVAGGAGGVAHWCADPFRIGGTPVGDGGRSCPEPPDPGAVRVARGGCWSWASSDCSLDIRTVVPSEYRMETIGFRLVCSRAQG